MAHISGKIAAGAGIDDIKKVEDDARSQTSSSCGDVQEVDLEVDCKLPEDLQDRIIATMTGQQKIHALLDNAGFLEDLYAERHARTRLALIVVSFFAIITSCIVFTIESLPQFYERDLTVFFVIEAVCIGWFSIEIALRFYSTARKIDYFRSAFNWIDIIAVLPFFISIALAGGKNSQGMDAVVQFLRLTRVVRVFKLSKYNQDLHVVILAVGRSSDALSMLLFMVVISVVLFGAAMFYAEQGAAYFDEDTETWIRKDAYGGPDKAHPYQSIFHAFWWCFVTVTTVGYGDMYPVTLPGYLVATCAMITGLLIIAFPIIVLGTNFTEARINYFRQRQEEFILQNMLKTELMTAWEQEGGSLSADDLARLLENDFQPEDIQVVDPDLLEGNMQELNVTGLLETLRQRVEGLEAKVVEYEVLFQALVESGQLGTPALKEVARRARERERDRDRGVSMRLPRIKSQRLHRPSAVTFSPTTSNSPSFIKSETRSGQPPLSTAGTGASEELSAFDTPPLHRLPASKEAMSPAPLQSQQQQQHDLYGATATSADLPCAVPHAPPCGETAASAEEPTLPGSSEPERALLLLAGASPPLRGNGDAAHTYAAKIEAETAPMVTPHGDEDAQQAADAPNPLHPCATHGTCDGGATAPLADGGGASHGSAADLRADPAPG